MKGRLQIYTGDGKGKTTAALGQLIRFLGRGGKARLIQFDKTASDEGELYGERKILASLQGLDFSPTGMGRFDPDKKEFRFENNESDLNEVSRGLQLARESFADEYGLVVLDEVLSLPLTKMAKREDILALIDGWEANGRKAELVMTGHVSWDELVKRADLVTRMRKVKHYYDAGHDALKGIDF
jgi:cob(I)alamin adenosyltransferase